MNKIQFNPQQRKITLFLNEKRISFSIREYTILQEILNGKAAAEIAKEQYVSPKTIETYIMQIKLKLGCEKKREITPFLLWHDLAKEILLFQPECTAEK